VAGESRTRGRPPSSALSPLGRRQREARPQGKGSAETGVVPCPPTDVAPGTSRLDLLRVAPSGRSLITGLILLAAALASYGIARGTSAFAVEEIAVQGPPRQVAAEVARVLRGTRGESLLGLDLARLQAVVADVPSVASVRFDRAFPHTLRAVVVPERPVAVLRQGRGSWLVAASGRVIKPLERRQRPGLPRIWLRADVELVVGDTVSGRLRDAVRTVAPLVRGPLPARLASVRYLDDELTLVLRSRTEIRFGDASDRALKLELARRIIPRLLEHERYLDVSVPARPVAGSTLNSQVKVETSTSSLR
jgi:cell division protein FtsQ